jgi:21S rRNA (GM2251-2'-O)-methyltransferase
MISLHRLRQLAIGMAEKKSTKEDTPQKFQELPLVQYRLLVPCYTMKTTYQLRLLSRFRSRISPQKRPFSESSQLCGRPGSAFSAIHRGLRRAEPSRIERRGERTTRENEDRYARMARKDRRKKTAKDEEEEGPPSRRKRFNDPESTFGKKSLVYRVKHGDLKDKARGMIDKAERRSSGYENSDPEFMSSRSERRPSGPTSSGFAALEKQSWEEGPSRHSAPGAGRSRSGDALQRRNSPRQRYSEKTPSTMSRSPRQGPYEERSAGFPRSPRRDGFQRNGDFRDSMSASATRPEKFPHSLPYTTAASQFLYGTTAVLAALTYQKRQLYKLYIAEGSSNEVGQVRRLANQHDIPIEILPRSRQSQMDKMSMGRPHNGLILEASPLPQPPITALLPVSRGPAPHSPVRMSFELGQQSKEDEAINGLATYWDTRTRTRRSPLVLLLFQIVDPGNVGNIIRTARFMGINAIGITRHSSSTITPVVLKAAAGAAEELNIFAVDDPLQFLQKSRANGWATYAACPPQPGHHHSSEGRTLTTDDLVVRDPLSQDPCILVLGNEGHGLPRHLIRYVDNRVFIPIGPSETTVDSLNVTVAGALICEAFLRNQGNQGKVHRGQVQDLRKSLHQDVVAEEAAEGENVVEEEKHEKMW